MATNDCICQEDEVRVLLPAEKIPDGATTTKRTGDKTYTLKREVKLYYEGKSEVLVSGYFLFGPRGDINQVEPTDLLHWVTTAEDFVDDLQRSWEGAPQ